MNLNNAPQLKRRLGGCVFTLVTTFLLSLFISATYAQKQTIQIEKGSIEQAIAKIRSTYGVVIAYNKKDVAGVNATAGNYTGQTIEQVLSATLKGTALTYQKNGTAYVLLLNEKSPNVQAGQGPGTLKGRIVEFETSQPLPGASVRIPALNKGISSNESGYYRLEGLPAGKYTLEVSFVSYKTETIQVTVRSGDESTYDVKLQGDNLLSEVEITGIARVRAPVAHTTERQVLQEIKNAQSVVSGISSQEISKSADRNAAEVVKRISGVTIRDDKFIVIRGLNERYNLTYLNDNIAPSTELYSRAFALDLIPTRIIDKILVYKSPAPDLLADMTGGAVKIYTKDAAMVKHFDIEVQTGYREGTTFNKDFLTYKGSGTDFLGFDNGLRRLPSSVPGYGDFTKANISQKTYAKTFSNVLTYDRQQALPNMQLTANYYNSFKVGGRQLSILSSLSYKNERQHMDIDRTQRTLYLPNDPFNGTVNVGQESQNAQTAQLSLLQNFSYKLNTNNTLYFKNFLMQQGNASTILTNIKSNQRLVNGEWTDPSGNDLRNRNIVLSYSQRFLYSGNVGGKHRVDSTGRHLLDWNAGYTYSKLDIPDQRAIHFQNNTRYYQYPFTGTFELGWIPVYRSEEGSGVNNNIDLGMISRVWIRNTEMVYNASVDYTFKWRPWLSLKAGTYQQWKQRTVFRRVYTVNEGDVAASGYSYGLIGLYDPDMDFNLVFFHPQDLDKVWSANYLRDDGTGLKVIDRTKGSDAYMATEQNNSGYAALSFTPFNGMLDVYGGLRAEYNRQKVAGALSPGTSYLQAGGVNKPVMADLKSTEWLPSLNISFRPDSSIVIRGGYGKTVNRPEFRELSPYSELDYVNNQNIAGNSELVTARAENYDLRAEWYPKSDAGETFSIGVFYKNIQHPIERVISRSSSRSGYGSDINFSNADRAVIRGIEFDVRKNFSFIPLGFFRNLSFIASASLIRSKVEKADSSINAQVRKIDRQLQGQSPYSVNLGLYYENPGLGTKIALIANETGPRIYAASLGAAASSNSTGGGVSYQGSLIELKRRQLDLVVTQRLVKTLQVKLGIQNLLNDRVQVAEDYNFTYKYEKADGLDGDLLASDYKPGRFVNLGITYSF